MNQRGFGLFGLLITVAVIGLLLWFSVKSLSSALPSLKTESGVDQTPIEAAKQVKKILEQQDAARAPAF